MRESFFPDEDLVQRLPLPLAQLYRRAHNAKTPLERHNTAFFFWEASLKLLGAVAIVEYAERSDHDPALNERLANLARPSLGHWWEFVRKLVPFLADKGDAGFGKVRELLLGKARSDLPRAAGLHTALHESLAGKKQSRSTVSPSDLFDRLVRYRNQEIGHGAAGRRPAEFYAFMGKAMLAGVGEILGRLDCLAGRRLLSIADVNLQPAGGWLVQRFELVGETARRIESLVLPPAATASPPRPERVYLEALGQLSAGPMLHSLHPLVLHDTEADEVLFLNSRRGRQRIEYLGYTTGRVLDRPDLGGEQRELLSRILDMPVDEGLTADWAATSQAEEQAAPGTPSSLNRQIGEFELWSELGRGGMGSRLLPRFGSSPLARQVAVKKLQRTGDARAEARFAREIRALGRVEHPHLVKIFTSGAEGEHWFYAMELVEGATLAAICERLQGRPGGTSRVDLPTWQSTLSTLCEESRQAERLLSESSSGSQRLRHLGEAFPKDGPAAPGHRGYVRHVVELITQVADAAHALHEAGILLPRPSTRQHPGDPGWQASGAHGPRLGAAR